MSENIQKLENAIKRFDSFDYYLNGKLNRDIEENRKGAFVLNFLNSNGEPLEDAKVKIKQVSNEFKFGCNIFMLDGFPDKKRNEDYRNAFKEIFNYSVVPFYWDTLEPTEGKPRFGKNSEILARRPAIDTIMEFCEQNNIKMKGHCLVYNSFQPDWLPIHNDEIKIKLRRRIREIAEHCGDKVGDFDVINEMLTIYKNCYKGNGARNLQITDEKNHEKQSFDMCRSYLPDARLFWNEGVDESMGSHYRGHRSFYYMTLEKMLSEGVPVDGIGMQYHAFDPMGDYTNPLRIIDVLECYGKFDLPIHISEVTIPSFGNDDYGEVLQAELTKRLFRLWFSQKNCEAIAWWNFADGTAYGDENKFHGGLLRNDCSPKPAYKEIENLIKSEWRTTFESNVCGQLRFSGFYGKYEVEISHNGKKTTKQIDLFKDNTGYDNRLMDFRSIDVVV